MAKTNFESNAKPFHKIDTKSVHSVYQHLPSEFLWISIHNTFLEAFTFSFSSCSAFFKRVENTTNIMDYTVVLAKKYRMSDPSTAIARG